MARKRKRSPGEGGHLATLAWKLLARAKAHAGESQAAALVHEAEDTAKLLVQRIEVEITRGERSDLARKTPAKTGVRCEKA